MKARVLYAIRATYEAIGYDLEECAQHCGEKLTLEGAIEACIDADRAAELVGAFNRNIKGNQDGIEGSIQFIQEILLPEDD